MEADLPDPLQGKGQTGKHRRRRWLLFTLSIPFFIGGLWIVLYLCDWDWRKALMLMMSVALTQLFARYLVRVSGQIK